MVFIPWEQNKMEFFREKKYMWFQLHKEWHLAIISSLTFKEEKHIYDNIFFCFVTTTQCLAPAWNPFCHWPFIFCRHFGGILPSKLVFHSCWGIPVMNTFKIAITSETVYKGKCLTFITCDNSIGLQGGEGNHHKELTKGTVCLKKYTHDKLTYTINMYFLLQ